MDRHQVVLGIKGVGVPQKWRQRLEYFLKFFQKTKPAARRPPVL
jgi:hypothetical protein